MQSVSLCAIAVLAVSGSVQGGFSTTNPGYTDVDSLFQARVRVDGGGSQTWKTAFWDGTDLLDTSGNFQNVFNDGQTYNWSLYYNALTGAASFIVEDVNIGGGVGDLILNDTILLDPGKEFVGFRFFNNSRVDEGTTLAANMSASVDGGAAAPVADLLSPFSGNFVESDYYYFDTPAETLSFSGQVNFDWDAGANLQGDRFKLTIIPLQGVPTPGTAALLGFAGLFGARRRRA